MVELNEQQAAIVRAPASGAIKVSALAGTGKSRSVLQRVEHLYEQDEGKILLLAFNTSIAEELRERLKLLDNQWAANRTTVHTTYALGYYMVRKHWSKLGLPSFPKVAPEWEIIKDGLAIAKGNGYRLTEPGCKALLAAEAWRRSAQAVDYSEFIARSKVLKDITNTKTNPKAIRPAELLALSNFMSNSRRSKSLITYMDMIELAVELKDIDFENEHFKHILADEAQDLGQGQYSLIKRFNKFATSLTLIGDENQSCYGFAGASPEVFEQAKDKFNTTEYPLTVNYRSTHSILDLGNKVLKHPMINSELTLIPYRKEIGNKPEILNREDVGLWVDNLINSGVPTSEIAILFRARSHTLELETILAKAKIDYTCTSGSFFEHPVIKDVLAYYRLLMNDATEEDWRIAVRHRTKFISNEVISEAYSMMPSSPWKASPKKFKTDAQKAVFRGIRNDLEALGRRIKDSSPLDILSELSQDYLNYKWVDDYSEDPDLEAEYMMMITALVDWLGKYSTGEDFYEEYRNRPKPSKGGVLVSSVHKAKGLEWEHVGIWNLGDNIFPLKEEPEEYRILYVAVTRAKEELKLFPSKTDTSGGILGRLVSGESAEVV
jgi:DNA helicase-2/ATP-dependent DNA helicase PcrA